MKKVVLVFLFFGILFQMSSWAQTNIKVANGTKELVVVNGVNIPSRNLKEVSLPVSNNTASFEVVYYEGLVKKGPITLTREVNKNRIEIRDFTQNGTPSTSGKQRNESTGGANLATSPIPAANNVANASNWWAEVDVKPKNSLKGQSLFVPSDPFKGLALRPGQESKRTATLKTGTIVFPVFLASNDSTGKAGNQFAWALVNKIITEGQTTFEFMPQDIMQANAGAIVKKTIISKLPSPFIISDGKSRGIVISPNVPQRLELYVGWNIVPIQYKDANGFPTEAILILLVDSHSRALMAKAKNKADEISVVPSNVVITNLGR
ncbi:MAG: hypothetical protein WCT50_01835 [Patescibacteria group bacterium]